MQAAQFCLEKAGIRPDEVDAVAFVNESFGPGGIANILFKRPALFRQADWVEENEIYWKPKLLEGRDPGHYFDLMGGWDRVPDHHYYDFSALDMHADPEVVTKSFNELRVFAVESLLGISREKIHFLPHYICHHYHAYYSSRCVEKTLLLSMQKEMAAGSILLFHFQRMLVWMLLREAMKMTWVVCINGQHLFLG